ncbi:hypothetical protein EFT87_02690 [Schleiferilactobacillus harbinensis]|jgi:hypothetical protein|uniref:Uncharacterized protein n=1 Tax=Schleiferilactobacillus harbinensis TaxID=304207 RepID=A0A5P8M2V8_9LACO|nr:hypothetical protein [Schleiferilactobacillus harbinensis]QFR22605.1 hypothetical protein D1010_03615 [Schleiferilactobacillus harbinensis]
MGSAVQPHGGLPPMWLGVFETAQQAQTAVTAFQPILPELAKHWHGNQSTTLHFTPSATPSERAILFPSITYKGRPGGAHFPVGGNRLWRLYFNV